jgi:uncharacterized protein (DUF983 family)
MPTDTKTQPETTTKPVRGFSGLRCPRCFEPNGMALDLHFLESVRCEHCDEETRVKDIREMMSGWAAVLAFLELAPVILE